MSLGRLGVHAVVVGGGAAGADLLAARAAAVAGVRAALVGAAGAGAVGGVGRRPTAARLAPVAARPRRRLD